MGETATGEGLADAVATWRGEANAPAVDSGEDEAIEAQVGGGVEEAAAAGSLETAPTTGRLFLRPARMLRLGLPTGVMLLPAARSRALLLPFRESLLSLGLVEFAVEPLRFRLVIPFWIWWRPA